MDEHVDYQLSERDSTTRHAQIASFDTDHDERDAAPFRRGTIEHKISEDFSMTMIGKMDGLNDHGQLMKDFQNLGKTAAEVEFVPEFKWEAELIPNTQEMQLRSLKYPYSPGTAFWLNVADGATKAHGEIFARETMLEIYRMFLDMAPALTFRPSLKDLKCKGTFTLGSSSCTWEMQNWRVDPSVARSNNPENEYIFECRRKLQGGNDAFMRLVEIVGCFLKEQGRATMFANGCEIFPPAPPVEDLGKLAIPGLESYSNDFSMNFAGEFRDFESSEFPITLDDDVVALMTMGIADRRSPQCSENMAIFAQCAVDMDNRDLLQESDELKEAIHQELMKGTDLTTCINALTLIEHGVVSPKGALAAVARSLKVHSGYKESGFKNMRSRAVEVTALRVMAKLACNIGEDREETLLEIEKELRGKLVDEVFSKVQDIRTCLPTVNAF